MPLADYQVSYNGLTVGEGTSYGLILFDGTEMPDIEDNDMSRFATDGDVAGLDLIRARFLTLEFDIIAQDAAELMALLNTARTALAIRKNPTDLLNLVWKFPGEQELHCAARPRKRSMPITREYTRFNPTIAVQFKAPDPTILSDGGAVVRIS